MYMCTIILPSILIVCYTFQYWGHGCRGRMVVRFTTTCAISDYYTSSNSVHCKVYAIMFVSDLRQVGGFLPALRFPPPIQLTATI
jgi:hypothetical protein